MKYSQIKQLYKSIFESYDTPTLETHIKKIIELDFYLPYSSTFFCITNTQDLTFEYISKNFNSCLGLDANELKVKGMRYFWSRIHPDDIDIWLSALNSLMEFTITEIPAEKRQSANYTWNYRLKNANDVYVNIIQNTTPLAFDSDMKPIIGLAHYTVLDANIKMQITASAKLLNAKNEYETIYFNNHSQKLLEGGISKRERDVVRLLVLNNTSKEISEKLSISSHTVDTHRRNILKKLNISSTGELIGMLKTNKNLI
ncbi:LuxR C-terminal-related transcriptional regulator [Oceanihabitans sp. 2_MG-2023]|uniref:LuxR C-terminal-related transcriptional regulator n=1 Tax=Oceanihabitans sp. 2_MG-2023 TaxID=3062661 RepID=UPI0026E23697|nr:LuxR C-terminal-related transcriptional regulator [Oceanihabitans sp. 2_MG-2023]MDO6597291.1 LuxR C-terminal-related transcriptional regulator [Oceanihabitans sp. 2_MG-2023]